MSVHWVIDRALGRSEGGYENLVAQLERIGTGYTLVRKPPFADYLVGMEDNDTPITIDVPNPVFVTGTTSMGLVSKKMGWNPGYIDAPGQAELIEVWGSEVLNHDAVMGPLGTIEPPGDGFFIRPVEDTKSFAGQLMNRDEFYDWRAKIVEGDFPFATLGANDEVMMASLKNIYAEYRLYVIAGEIVTGSRYKLGNRVFYTSDLDPQMLDYARERIKEYRPREAMCLDIAQVEGDTTTYKVIETNAISSAGFYACDMGRFVSAINDLYG